MTKWELFFLKAHNTILPVVLPSSCKFHEEFVSQGKGVYHFKKVHSGSRFQMKLKLGEDTGFPLSAVEVKAPYC